MNIPFDSIKQAPIKAGMDAETKITLAGWSPLGESRLSAAEAAAYWDELACNKQEIHWKHWLALPTLEAHEAAHLLSGVDPDPEQHRPEADKKRTAIAELRRLGERQPPADQSPRGWHDWAAEKGIEPFLNYVKNLPAKEQEPENVRVKADPGEIEQMGSTDIDADVELGRATRSRMAEMGKLRQGEAAAKAEAWAPYIKEGRELVGKGQSKANAARLVAKNHPCDKINPGTLRQKL